MNGITVPNHNVITVISSSFDKIGLANALFFKSNKRKSLNYLL